MGAYVRFADPLPDLLLKRALLVLQPVADLHGLNGVLQSKRVQFKMTETGGAIPEVLESIGQVFNRRADAANVDVIEAPLLEQVALDHNSLVYRTWDYVSWEWHFDRITELLRATLATLSEAVAFQSVGVEYLDKFKTNDEDPAPLADLLQRDSRLVADHVFDVPDLFHSHTGAFQGTDHTDQILHSVKIDAVREGEERVINITTGFEHRYSDIVENADVFAVFDEAHTGLKDLLGSLITEKQAQLIYLQV